MFTVDFTEFTSFSKCPIWWQNFINLLDITPGIPTEYRNLKIDRELSKHNCLLIPFEDSFEDFRSLEFESEQDYLVFVLRFS